MGRKIQIRTLPRLARPFVLLTPLVYAHRLDDISQP